MKYRKHHGYKHYKSFRQIMLDLDDTETFLLVLFVLIVACLSTFYALAISYNLTN